MVKWRVGDDEEENRRVGDACIQFNNEPTRTVQSFAQDADINVLVRRFGIEKVASTVIDPSMYGDFTQAPDLRGALEIMRDAEDQFMKLSPKIRGRFENSPAKLWEFLQDPSNLEEAVFLGFVEKRALESNVEVSGPSPENLPAKPGSPEGAD